MPISNDWLAPCGPFENSSSIEGARELRESDRPARQPGENSYWPPSEPDQVVKLRERSGVTSCSSASALSLLNSTRAPPSTRSFPLTRVCKVKRPVCRWRLSGRNFSSPTIFAFRSRYWRPLVPPQPERSDWTSSKRPSPPLLKKVDPIVARVFELVVMIVGVAAARADVAEESADRNFRAEIVARLLLVDGRSFGLDRRDRANSGSEPGRSRGGGSPTRRC